MYMTDPEFPIAKDPGDTEPTIPDDPDLPVPNDPGDSEPILIKRRGYLDQDDGRPLL